MQKKLYVKYHHIKTSEPENIQTDNRCNMQTDS